MRKKFRDSNPDDSIHDKSINELLEKFKGGEIIEAKFYRLKECNNPLLKDMVFCAMYHQNEGWVKVWF